MNFVNLLFLHTVFTLHILSILLSSVPSVNTQVAMVSRVSILPLGLCAALISATPLVKVSLDWYGAAY